MGYGIHPVAIIQSERDKFPSVEKICFTKVTVVKVTLNSFDEN